jgi:saccharopine dehydrogenase (NAD+, L-lysine-forming)
LSWLIYGANGYTGRLTAERAAAEGELPILAGRREAPVRELAERLDLPWRAFGLDDAAELEAQLRDVDLVLHCAGPFSATSRPMVQACLATRTHYLDITGEIAVFEGVLAQDARAKEAGVVLLPGAGFDVVPSDCLAAALAAALPGAVQLELAFATLGGRLSPGTTKTMLEGLPHGGCVRKDGRLTSVPAAHRTRSVPFARKARPCVAIPWGDVSTAYHSTGIPNIVVFTAQPRLMTAAMKASRPFAGLLRSPRVQSFLRAAVDRFVHGPSEEERRAARTELWGAVTDAEGRRVEGTLEVPEGYSFTVDASLVIAERVLAGDVAPGAWTPSCAFGAEFVTTLPHTELRVPAGSEPIGASA